MTLPAEARSTPTVAVITVGDEILSGRICDRHSAWVSAALEPLGYRMSYHLSVGDEAGALARVLRHPPVHTDALIIAGGLGPTDDDRTRAEVAAALGDDLEFRDESWERIAAYYRSFGREPSPLNRRQAFFPASAREILNPHGTAPAFMVEHPETGQILWVLPGVPHELHALFRSEVLPAMQRRWEPSAVRLATYHFFGISESELAEWLRTQLPSERSGDYHICVSDGEIEVRLDPRVEIAAAATRSYGSRFLGAGEVGLAARLVGEATDRGVTFAIAESCTGGLVGARVTAIAGASRAFRGGWITYDNEWKQRELGVSSDGLEVHGAVSAEVACAMAAGASSRGGVDFAVAVTGIAGPAGGSATKPVGTVYFGLASGRDVYWLRKSYRGDRERVRSLSANQALHALWCAVRGQIGDEWLTLVS
ncbi:MAG: CinA family nicotinamide mononucleotide deamidase-related protein [Planctomycetota bacterium]